MEYLRFYIALCFSVSYSTCLSASCDPIRIEMCRGLGYNFTSMPNLVGHELQQDAEMQLQTFSPLIQFGCSSQLRFFLCSVYVPMCTEKVPDPIGPCRTLCENVRFRCQPILQEFGFSWLSALNCSKFPVENNQNHMCMEGPGEEVTEPRDPYFPIHGNRRVYGNNQNLRQPTRNLLPVIRTDLLNPILNPCSSYKNNDFYVFINQTESCVPLCNVDILFRREDKQFIGVWVAVWTIFCFITTFFTIITFLLDSSRFRFPERAIIFIAISYNLYSIGHLIRVVVGRDGVACSANDENSVLIQEGLSHINCAIVFLLLYYFGMASSVWWVILSLTWYLTVGLRWTYEAVERYSGYFHIAAWAIPAIQTIVALLNRVVDADELSGTCFVGQQSTSNLFMFIILPQFLYILLGLGFFVVGLIRVFQQDKPSLELKESAFSVQSGIFNILYILLTSCVLGVNIYEYARREDWLMSGSDVTPNVEMFIFKIFVVLITGVVSGMWICSRQTMQTWRRLGKKLIQHQDKQTSILLSIPNTGGNKHLIVLDTKVKMPLAKTGSETAV